MRIRNTLANIRVVLIQTSHPGNIGSTARAMKTMGFSDLCLVNPKSFPDDQATAMSSNASDILAQAKVVNSLSEAIADCELVIGSSARDKRSLSWEILTSRDCGKRVIERAENNNKVALVFGRESSGLTNDELAFCHYLVNVPTNPDYSSLNVASAVQILCYECRMSGLDSDVDNTKNSSNALYEVENKKSKDKQDKATTAKEMEAYYQHLETAMIESQFLDPQNPKHLMTRLRRLFGRTRMTKSELNIMRGMLSAFQKKGK